MTGFIIGVIVGVLIGWSIPEPEFVKRIKEKIKAKFA
jgi:hypothetical protein